MCTQIFKTQGNFRRISSPKSSKKRFKILALAASKIPVRVNFYTLITQQTSLSIWVTTVHFCITFDLPLKTTKKKTFHKLTYFK